VVVVEDSVWMNHVDPVSMITVTMRFQVSGDGTVSQIFKLVVRALLAHDVASNSEYFLGVVDIQTLLDFVSELVRMVPQRQSSRRGTVFMNIYNRWRMERKVREVVYER